MPFMWKSQSKVYKFPSISKILYPPSIKNVTALDCAVNPDVLQTRYIYGVIHG